ncbi:hypothetical protein ACH5RR_009697 [Cinchona calisaya]|uniref:Germin-like protein n=1 Tax=Cinchona calisaya TaxID=153742 RepID=A0ABD3AEW4_9GENT
MASISLKITLLGLLLAFFANSWIAKAGDPDITSDFLVNHKSGPVRTVNPPHTHPCSESYYLSCKELFRSTGRVQLFSFQYNSDFNSAATAILAFGSANVGTASIPATLFATGVDDAILVKSFKTDLAIQKIKAGLASNT